jgi:hypothetical protein
MAPTRPDLTDVNLRLERAKEHIETVRHQTKAFLERDPKPFDFRAEKAPGTGEAVEYILYAVVREEPPHRLGAPVGDAIQNIRNALDYLVYGLSPPKYRRRGKTGFPIYDDECLFEVEGRKLIRGITGDELTLIERFQPYKRTNPARNDPLSILRRLSNKDKHRLLLPVVAAVSDSGSWIASTNATIELTYYAPGPVKHNAKIMTFTARPEDPSKEMYVEPQSGLEIQLGEVGMFYPEGVPITAELSDFLEYLLHYVSHDLIAMWFEYGYMPPEVVDTRPQ